MTTKTSVFVTGFSSQAIASTPAPKASQATTRPAAAINATQATPTPAPQGKPPMKRPTDAQLLCELAAKTIGDAAFAVNTNALTDARSRLTSALSLVNRAIAATPGIHGNAGRTGGEFDGYDINNPTAR